MEISALFVCLILSLGLCELYSAVVLTGSGDGLKQRAGVGVSTSSLKCKLQGSTRLPAFSLDGDYVIGGVISIHNLMHTVKYNYTSMPETQRCTGRLVSGRGGGGKKRGHSWGCLICLFAYNHVSKVFCFPKKRIIFF